MKKIVFACVALGWLVSCCGVNKEKKKIKVLSSNIPHSRRDMCDAIYNGDLNYFNGYCETYTTIGTTKASKIIKKLCRSRHENSTVMLEIFLKKYAQESKYLLRNFGEKYIVRALNSYDSKDTSLKIILGKTNILLDTGFLVQSFDDWKKIYESFMSLKRLDNELLLHLAMTWNRCQNVLRSMSNSIILPLCSSNDIASSEKLQFLLDNHLLSSAILYKRGIVWLLEILDTVGDNDEQVEVAVKKLTMLFDAGALGIKNYNELHQLFFKKLQDFFDMILTKKFNNQVLVQDSAFLFAQVTLCYQLQEEYEQEVQGFAEGLCKFYFYSNGSLLNGKVLDI